MTRGNSTCPVVQTLGVALTLRNVRRWQREPASQPRDARKWLLHIALPAIPNLALAAMPVALLANGLMRFSRLFVPDIAWLSIVSGGFAAIWLCVRSWLVLRPVRK